MMNETQPITDKKQLAELMDVYDKDSKQYLLLVFALNTGLRISDILNTNTEDSIRKGLWIGKEKKTDKPKTVELNAKLQLFIRDFIEKEELPIAKEQPLFFSNKDRTQAISRVQAHRIISKAGDMVDLDISAHSLRKTFGYVSYKNGTDLSLLQYIFNHSSQAVTLKYIGITQDQANEVYRTTSIGI